MTLIPPIYANKTPNRAKGRILFDFSKKKPPRTAEMAFEVQQGVTTNVEQGKGDNQPALIKFYHAGKRLNLGKH